MFWRSVIDALAMLVAHLAGQSVIGARLEPCRKVTEQIDIEKNVFCIVRWHDFIFFRRIDFRLICY